MKKTETLEYKVNPYTLNILYCEVIFLKNKTRKQKQKEYSEKFGGIPINYEERLEYMIDKYNLSENKMNEIIEKKNQMLSNLFFYQCTVVQLLEIPEGTSRPRFTRLNKSNFNKAAISDNFIHVYTPHAAEDHMYMKQLCQTELEQLDYLINTPCYIKYDAFYKTPNYLNTTDTFLSEIGLIRPPIDKPDWDNVGKKYCDMYNHNIWLDDSLVVDGEVHKYYSILPRIEITLYYLNAVYNKAQYRKIISRKNYDDGPLAYLDNTGRIINDTSNEFI